MVLNELEKRNRMEQTLNLKKKNEEKLSMKALFDHMIEQHHELVFLAVL